MPNTQIDPRIIDPIALDNAPDLLTADLLAPLVHMSRSRLYVLMRDPGFPVSRVGCRKYIRKDNLIAWLGTYQHTSIASK